MRTDLVADVLTKIRNAQRAKHKSVKVEASAMVSRVLKVLQTEGFIESVSPTVDENGFDQLDVVLRYYDSGEPLISSLVRVSKPGRRVYAEVRRLKKVLNGLGISIISTSRGVISDREARKLGVGGEVIAQVG